ncbi:ribosomal protein S5 domain 2-like protein [Durotheca rogersii]|uniref:ribosomal protein S5 domain 2-like protein n=1 Tax=Durotheca rogersii TaxID=419775 RepID=UPI00221F068D|nr:ribosomal protein S5 domain 2-like protein [Durotheca rogersii]KAI5865774.1 ribosomal protein S5 domain 2-like protein [Durotheca rogersii]
MPLDTSAYGLALLRVDGRRWNELRQMRAQMRTQASADGSSYLEMGNTKVMCVVAGPTEDGKLQQQRRAGGGGSGGGGAAPGSGGNAEVIVSIVVAGFSSVDRKKRTRNDKRILELQTTVCRGLAANLHTHLFPRSTIGVSLYVLAQDGSLLAALFNAATLALVDAGVPMADYLVACTAGSAPSLPPAARGGAAAAAADDAADPLIDLNAQEETELPWLTLATLGATDRVVALVCETRVPDARRLEAMMAAAADGCARVRAKLDRAVRRRGRRVLAGEGLGGAADVPATGGGDSDEDVGMDLDSDSDADAPQEEALKVLDRLEKETEGGKGKGKRKN